MTQLKSLNLDITTNKNDVYKFLSKTSLKADVIFADPPYDFETEKFLEIVDTVFDKDLLISDGVLIIEHSKHTDLTTHEETQLRQTLWW